MVYSTYSKQLTWKAKYPIFLGNFTPNTSNYCLKNMALGFPGTGARHFHCTKCCSAPRNNLRPCENRKALNIRTARTELLWGKRWAKLGMMKTTYKKPMTDSHGNLVGDFNPFEKYTRQNGFIFPKFRGENKKHIWNHHLGIVYSPTWLSLIFKVNDIMENPNNPMGFYMFFLDETETAHCSTVKIVSSSSNWNTWLFFWVPPEKSGRRKNKKTKNQKNPFEPKDNAISTLKLTKLGGIITVQQLES